jgi:hypothetical protein
LVDLFVHRITLEMVDADNAHNLVHLNQGIANAILVIFYTTTYMLKLLFHETIITGGMKIPESV